MLLFHIMFTPEQMIIGHISQGTNTSTCGLSLNKNQFLAAMHLLSTTPKPALPENQTKDASEMLRGYFFKIVIE